MKVSRLVRPLALLAVALGSLQTARAVTILSVNAYLNAPDDPRNYVDVWIKQSPDPWRDRHYGVGSEFGGFPFRVQAGNVDPPDYIHEPKKSNTIYGVWDNHYNDRYGHVWSDFYITAYAHFPTKTATSLGSPLQFFFAQFYGDAVRFIWTNDAIEPRRVPDGGSTLPLLATGLCAVGMLLGLTRRPGRAVATPGC